MKLISVADYARGANINRSAVWSRYKNGTISFVRRGNFNFIDLDKYPIVEGKRGRPTAAESILRRKKGFTKTLPK